MKISIEYCSKGNGTNLVAYDMAKRIVDALYDAVLLGLPAVKALGKFVALIMPDGWVIPIITDDQPSFARLPTKRFRCISIDFELPSILAGETEPHSIEFPFPKKSLQSLWEAFVAPIDTYIEGSEYWPYRDEATGEIKQGLMFDPVKKFGILTNLPKTFIWGSVVLAISAVLVKAGLGSIASNFYRNVTLYVRNKRVMSSFEDIQDTLDDYILEDQAKQTTIEGKIDSISESLRSIEAKIGLRLVMM